MSCSHFTARWRANTHSIFRCGESATPKSIWKEAQFFECLSPRLSEVASKWRRCWTNTNCPSGRWRHLSINFWEMFALHITIAKNYNCWRYAGCCRRDRCLSITTALCFRVVLTRTKACAKVGDLLDKFLHKPALAVKSCRRFIRSLWERNSKLGPHVKEFKNVADHVAITTAVSSSCYYSIAISATH